MAGDRSAGRRAPDFPAVLKDIKSLQADRGFRDRRGMFFIEGVRNFVEAVDNGFGIEGIYYSERLLTSPIARKLVRQCRRSGVFARNLTPEQFRQLSDNRRASGVAAILRQKWGSLGKVLPGQGLCWTVLETVRSPGNLGTLIRSSQAAGGAGFIFVGNSVDPFSPAVVRSAMGTVYCQTFIRVDWHALRLWKNEQKCEVIGATPEGAADLHAFAFPKTPLLVLGEERRGLNAQQRDLCSDFVRIPMQGGTDSLNLGVAGSLLMYEVYRSQARSIEVATDQRLPKAGPD